MKYISIEIKNDYALINMDRGKVNALESNIINEIRQTFQEIENNDQIRGIVLAGKPGYFSAGLDLIELYQYDEVQIREFFISFGRMHIELVKFSKPFVCAITGHSPAGGTVIAVTADHRVMAEESKYSIGLNEVSLNIQITQNLVNAYSYWLGKRNAAKNILAGKLLTPQESFDQGLVDEICPMENVIEKAEKYMKKQLWADSMILKNTKAKLRKEWIEGLEVGIEEELEMSLEIWWNPQIRGLLKAYIENFSGRKL